MSNVIAFPISCKAERALFTNGIRELVLDAAANSNIFRDADIQRHAIRRRIQELMPDANLEKVNRCTALMLRIRELMNEAVPL